MVEARTRRAPGGPLAVSPMFPGYLFVSFDRSADKWQRACGAQGVKRLFCSTPDYPVPIQRGIVESLIEKTRHGIVRLDPIPDFLQAGATVRLIGTPFMDQTGVCLWVKGDRVQLALTMFGRVLQPVVSRSQVEPA
jgi:transcriptional antiterminator RfaH